MNDGSLPHDEKKWINKLFNTYPNKFVITFLPGHSGALFIAF